MKRTRTRKQVQVECPSCGRDMPEARLTIAIARGVCASCNAPTLAVNRQVEMPEYETVVWARGGRL